MTIAVRCHEAVAAIAPGPRMGAKMSAPHAHPSARFVTPSRVVEAFCPTTM